MNVRIASYRTAKRADLWFVDLIGLAATGLAAGTLVLNAVIGGYWWIAGLLVLVGSCWTTRLRITREAPTEIALTVFWTVIPIRRHRAPIASVVSEHSDDWTARPEDPRDQLVLGSWDFHCRHADRVHESIRAAAAELNTPIARVREE